MSIRPTQATINEVPSVISSDAGTLPTQPGSHSAFPDAVEPSSKTRGLLEFSLTTIATATHLEGTGRKRGPVPKRRFQKGSFQVQNGKAYTLFYRDVESPDGTIATERARHLIGDLHAMSEHAARREHDLFMAEINRRRGSVPSPSRVKRFKTPLTHGNGTWLRSSRRQQCGSGKATSVFMFCQSSGKKLHTLWMFLVYSVSLLVCKTICLLRPSSTFWRRSLPCCVMRKSLE